MVDRELNRSRREASLAARLRAVKQLETAMRQYATEVNRFNRALELVPLDERAFLFVDSREARESTTSKAVSLKLRLSLLNARGEAVEQLVTALEAYRGVAR